MPAPDRARLRAAVVSVHYYPEYVAQSLRHLRQMCERLQPERCVLVANNPTVLPALQEAAARSRHAASVLLHDNSGLEFGAYQAGVDHLLADGEPDWTVILNDTFAIHQCFLTADAATLRACRDDDRRSRHADRRRAGRKPAAIVRAARDSHASLDHDQRLRRQSGSAARVEASTALRRARRPRRQGRRPPKPSFRRGSIRYCASTSAAGSSFRPAQLSWYRAAPLDEQNAPALARKARSILQEKYLSARLEAASTIFADIKQMSSSEKLLQRIDAMVFALRRHQRTSHRPARLDEPRR